MVAKSSLRIFQLGVHRIPSVVAVATVFRSILFGRTHGRAFRSEWERVQSMREQFQHRFDGIEGETAMTTRPPVPPFSRESAIQKIRLAEDSWNSRDPEKVAQAYTVDSHWRNRAEF